MSNETITNEEIRQKFASLTVKQQENIARILEGVIKLAELPPGELQRRMKALRDLHESQPARKSQVKGKKK